MCGRWSSVGWRLFVVRALDAVCTGPSLVVSGRQRPSCKFGVVLPLFLLWPLRVNMLPGASKRRISIICHLPFWFLGTLSWLAPTQRRPARFTRARQCQEKRVRSSWVGNYHLAKVEPFRCRLLFTGYRLCRGPLQHSSLRCDDALTS